MNDRVLISICIPAYKHVEYLRRLLDSIAIQTFKDFEVIVTDDSPGNEVKNLTDEYSAVFKVFYKKNNPIAGSPENWNQSILHAKGEWIKIMHDDDWFSFPESLQIFAAATQHDKKFIFSAYTNVYEQGGFKDIFVRGTRHRIIKNPMLLLVKNIIGPPSVIMVHKSISDMYDVRMKWRVDIDFYMTVLEKEKQLHYINQALIKVGISKLQVTNSCLNNPEVELPEGLLLLSKFGLHHLKNIWIYDTWWRLMRNMGIRSEDTLYSFTPGKKWPVAVLNLIRHQSRLKHSWLKVGVISKVFMMISYLLNRSFFNE